MHVVIAGGTGFVGSALCEALRARGDRVTVLSRQGGPGRITWQDPLPECDAVVNLCGEGILNRRWTPSFKKKIIDSRVRATRILVEKMGGKGYLVNASAVGYYPEGGKAPCGEESGPGLGFLAQVCEQWEAAAQGNGAIIRMGVVLGKGGGTFRMLQRVFRAGLGGRIGSGEQGFPWIHLDDLVALFLFVLDRRLEGVFNGTAPDLVTNGEFTQMLGKEVGRWTLFGVPGWMLRLGLGERAEAVLGGAMVYPERTLKAGFVFRYPTLDKALKELCNG